MGAVKPKEKTKLFQLFALRGCGSFSTTGPGQLRAVKDGEEQLSYESTTLVVNSTNPETPSVATTPSTQSYAQTGCALARRASASWVAWDPVIRRLIITRDGVRHDFGGDKQHVMSLQCLLGVLVPLSLSGSSVRWSPYTVCQHTKSFLIAN